MSEYIVDLALSNLLISSILAAIAFAVHRRGRYPVLAHLLWVLVLVKVVTPPVVQLPVVPGLGSAAVATDHVTTSATTTGAIGGVATAASGLADLIRTMGDIGPTLVLGIWALGSLVILAASLVRIARFDRLLRVSSTPAPRHLQGMAATTAWQLGLKSPPAIYTSKARLSPMTWWTGGAVRVVIPEALPQRIDAAQLQWMLAHELAHVKRRDHLVRWLEWLACVSFWWNPVVWFARRNLRLDEEVACDALVLERLHGDPRSYAKALLTVVEFLAGHAARPPAIASGIDAGGSLERRFVAIVSDGPFVSAPRSLAVGLVGSAFLLMCVGVGFAADARPSDDTRGQPSTDLAAPASRLEPGAMIGAGDGETDDPGSDRFALLGARVNVAASIAHSDAPNTTVTRGRGATYVGTPGDDVYHGTRGRDRIAGKDGADELSGRGQRDVILGGTGDDTLRGGAGPDKLIGGPGDDTIMGNRGRDVIRAGSGSDTIRSGAGDDVVKTWQDGLPDAIDCGAGEADRAIIDSTDTSVDCEVVIVRDAA